MVDKRLKDVGLNGVKLAKLTGQDPNTISRKVKKAQGLELGPREAGVMACFSLMDDDQRKQVDDAFEKIMESITD